MRTTATRAAVSMGLAAALSVAPCPAQDEAVPPFSGMRLRVTAPDVAPRPIVGTLLETTERHITLVSSDSDRTLIPRAAITRLERSQGRHRQTVKGMLIGAAAGAAVLAALDAQDPETGNAQEYVLVGAIGAGLGALAGAGVGALFKTERWAELPSTDLRVTVSPVRGHGVGVRVAWVW